MGSIAAKIPIPYMQFPNWNSWALCRRVICLFETVDWWNCSSLARP
jgi:hypothetical protein